MRATDRVTFPSTGLRHLEALTLAVLLTKSVGHVPAPEPHAPGPLRRYLHRAWWVVRQVAAGVDALSMTRHGFDVPPDHPARRRSSPAA